MKTAASCYEIKRVSIEDDRYYFFYATDTPYVRAVLKKDLKTA